MYFSESKKLAMENISEDLGKIGEKLAQQHLLTQGYKILETNWRFRKYEIDIIAEINQTIVFIEVKARKSDTFGSPEIFVSKHKQKFILAAAHQYIVQHNISLESRFDVISVLQLNNNQIVKHLEEAFYPTIS
jgi:putative endonuclease